MMGAELKQALRAAMRPFRSSRRVTRLLYGVNATSRVHDDLWDLTTLVLKKALDELVVDGDRVLELGTGHIGVLGIHTAKRRHVDLTAVDVSSAFIDNARAVARASGAPAIDFRTSNWFSNVSGRFDVIFVNLPYVPTATGVAFGASTQHAQTWDGGEDGCDTARAVLAGVGAHLSARGRLLLGVNRMYVPAAQMRAVIAGYPGLELERVVTSRLSPGEVHVVRPKAT